MIGLRSVALSHVPSTLCKITEHLWPKLPKARFPLPELTARVERWPVSITRQHGPCWRARVSTSQVDGPSTWRNSALIPLHENNNGGAMRVHTKCCKAQIRDKWYSKLTVSVSTFVCSCALDNDSLPHRLTCRRADYYTRLHLSPVSIQTQRTQRKRLRFDGNRALLLTLGLLYLVLYAEV